jgi:phosphohistidine phosphatase
MMEERRLIIMRHATADPGSDRDHARTLTAQGQGEAERAGLLLRSRGLTPQRVLCSSATRCRETWQAVSAALGCAPVVDFEDGLYNGSAEALLQSLAGVTDEQTVLLLAHNPGVSLLAVELGREDEESLARLRAGFAPASMACFEVEGPWSRLSARSARLTHFERAPKTAPKT